MRSQVIGSTTLSLLNSLKTGKIQNYEAISKLINEKLLREAPKCRDRKEKSVHFADAGYLYALMVVLKELKKL
jgi:hypothetical protein